LSYYFIFRLKKEGLRERFSLASWHVRISAMLASAIISDIIQL
jgi:hypothetical protein